VLNTTTKRLEDFDNTVYSHSSDPYRLFEKYHSVPFEELKAFDLLRLLHSFRKVYNDGSTLKIPAREKLRASLQSSGMRGEKIKAEIESKPAQLFERYDKMKEQRLKYVDALKAELYTRPSLSRHEKKEAINYDPMFV
jgi:hypothetical protein